MSADTVMDLLTLTAEDDETWSLCVDRRLCLGPPEAKHLSGGACTAILVDALEQVTGKPLIQASAQFLATPNFNENATVEVDRHKPGRSIDIATATLSCSGQPQVLLSGSFGARRNVVEHQWTRPPEVPPPETCKEIGFVRADPGDLHTVLEMRLAARPWQGSMAFWVRTPNQSKTSPARFLALIADYVPEAIHMNIGRPAGATSLDNSIGVTGERLTEWVLCVTQLDAIKQGIFRGRMGIFSERSELLATASQSGIVRLLDA